MTVAQFMAWALYHPEHGYYMTGPNIGPRGDFTTSPEASPAFGKLLATHVAEVDALLGHPPAFDIVECGPGRGTLAYQLLDAQEAQYPVSLWTLHILAGRNQPRSYKTTERASRAPTWR